MAEEKEKAAGATNTNGLTTPSINNSNADKKSEEIIPQSVAPVKKSRRKLLTEPQFIELAHKWHENKISIKEAAAILNVSWATFQKNSQILLGPKKTKMRVKRPEPMCISLKASATYQKRRSFHQRIEEHYLEPSGKPKAKPKDTKTCFACQKEYVPEATQYKYFKEEQRYFCSWSCKCRWLRSMGIEF